MDASPAPASRSERLVQLRAEMARRGLAGFVVPRADEHQGEYVAPRSERLTWLTGFTGSAGIAVVLAERAAVFSDGRYTLQMADQVDGDAYATLHITLDPPSRWLAENLTNGDRLGYDPWLHTVDGAVRLRKACAEAGAELVPCEDNPLDAVWSDQPDPPLGSVVSHPLDYAGESADAKRGAVAQALSEADQAAVVLTQPDSIAWLLNIRGSDVPHTPLALGFAILHADAAVELFMDRRKLSGGLDDHLGEAVVVAEPEDFGSALDRLGSESAVVRLDPASAADWIRAHLEDAGAKLARGGDPCALPKARKNEVELEGARQAHRRDGAALTRFLAWLAREAPGTVTEMAASDRLEAFRREGAMLQDLSFDTISGAGPNGAIVHYRVTEDSDRAIEADTLYLVDSGGQYLDGTTDVTRTVAIGEPTPEMRDRFTRVLKGHIALATVRFPKGTTGSQLDVLARQPLWQMGLDYDHGTGHGVGSYLGVHEGPQRISKIPNTVALEPGMIVSNEPGYYKTGAYGIRIENLVAVREAEPCGEQSMLEFETLTLAPIDNSLVDPGLLDEREAAWLDAYHARVRETLTPLVDQDTVAWLSEATVPVAAG